MLYKKQKPCNEALGRWLKAKHWHLPDITKRIQMWTLRDCDKTCTGSNQIKSQHWEGEQTVSRLPPEALCNAYLLQKGNTSFLHWGITAHVNHTSEQVLCLGAGDQHRIHSGFVCVSLVCWLVLVLAFWFALSWRFSLFIFIFFPVFVFVSEKGRKWNWVDRAVGRNLEQLGERKEYNQNILYEKIKYKP